MTFIQTLENLEPVFRQAGQMACKMQATAKQHNKTNTGWDVADVVTDADLAVQQFLLTEVAKTDLINCRLMAEEDTPLTKKFDERGKFYLGMDPIDGTAVYAKGGNQFSVIISLHDGKNLLYSYKHFPALDWTWKMVGNKREMTGREPEFDFPAHAKNKIVYYIGDPKTTAPDVYQELTNQGLEFARVDSLSKGLIAGSVMFITKKVAGFYTENTNPYDGLVNLHFAQTQGLKIYSGGPNGRLDFSVIKKGERGLYYPDYYLALNP